MSKEVVKNTGFNTLNTKANNLEKGIPVATNLIHINQYHIDMHNLEKRFGDADEKIPDVSDLVITSILNTKIKKVENKYQTQVV